MNDTDELIKVAFWIGAMVGALIVSILGEFTSWLTWRKPLGKKDKT